MTQITYEALRKRGFRIVTTAASHVPHMLIGCDRRMETALEVAPGLRDSWTVWLRSDLAHSRCRFCYVRNVESMEQLERLYAAISDGALPIDDYDAKAFDEALAHEKEDSRRHYLEYCKDQRWGYVP